MQRRHFEAIAETVKGLKTNEFLKLTQQQHEEIALTFSGMCRRENPRFDKARFLKACGVED